MDSLRQIDKESHIGAQLALIQGPKIERGTHLTILCPFHGEKTPSASISKSSGHLHCFGCGHNAKFDDWAPLYGLEPFQKGKPKDRYAQNLFAGFAAYAAESEDDPEVSAGAVEEESETPGYEPNPRDARLPEEAPYKMWRMHYRELPRNKKWRSVSTNLLRKIGGRSVLRYSEKYKRWSSSPFIYMPVMVFGEQKGYFLARMKKAEGLTSYLLAPSTGEAWAKNWGLWPFDYATNLMRKIDSTTMVIVEGQRDALRCLSMGVPAVCMFGSKSWSENKSRILEVAGVRRVVQFMDGDDAGISATLFTREFLDGVFDDVKNVSLWSVSGSPYRDYRHIEDEKERKLAADADGVEFWDPGNCPDWIIERIKSKWV